MPQSHAFSGASQVYWTCKALLAGRTISHQTEIREVRGWRLGAIVHRLRHEYGWPIQTDHRGPSRIAHYSLAPDTSRRSPTIPAVCKGAGGSGGRIMMALRIAHLRRRYGISEARARLLARLIYGG